MPEKYYTWTTIGNLEDLAHWKRLQVSECEGATRGSWVRASCFKQFDTFRLNPSSKSSSNSLESQKRVPGRDLYSHGHRSFLTSAHQPTYILRPRLLCSNVASHYLFWNQSIRSNITASPICRKKVTKRKSSQM